MPKIIPIVISCFFFSGLVWSLDPQKKISQYTLNTWKTERGLPNNSVVAIAQDRSGYLWLGTPEGLVRFDGMNFSEFDSKNTPAFRDNYISNLFFDRRGVLWIGTMRGELLSLENGTFQRHPLPRKFSNILFGCLAEDSQGRIWVGTFDGLFCRPPGDKRSFAKHLSFPDARINCLETDRSGRLWIGTTEKGLYVLENGQWRRVLPDNDALSSDIYALKHDRRGYLWLGTDDGLYNFKDNKLNHILLKQGLSDNITSLIEDRDGNLWAGSEEGLIRCQNGVFQSLVNVPGMSSNYISSLFEDAEGSLWVGAFDGGVTQVRDEKIATLTNQEGLAGGMFRSLYQDDSGALWIGGFGNSLTRYQNERCQNFILPDRFKSSHVFSLAKDKAGSFWLGTSCGLLNFQNGRFREIPLPRPNTGRETRSLLTDHQGRLWVGTWGGGLLCWDDGVFSARSTPTGLGDDHISSLFEDKQGNVWIGCERGLAVLPSGNPGKILVEKSLDNCDVVSFYEDRQGTLWIGTRNQGLRVHHDGRWGSLNSDQGLFDNRIYAILEDDLGHLWMSSERGIFRAKKNELQEAAFDKNLQVSGRLFDENDGMKSRICDFGNPAGWKDGSGRLWFANLAGVASIDPAHIRKNKRVPPVRVEEVVVDNRSLPLAGNSKATALRLAAGSKRFEFKYTALSFIRSDKIMFKYKLEGYDKEWTAAGSRREAFYNDLRPGRYNFRVIAANADGVWNTGGAGFTFTLRPFVYQTWWFMVLAAMAFSALSVLLWQLLKRYLHAVTFWKKKTHIGHFKILETIGTGGMATVYKAQDLLDKKRVVALKVLKEENFHDELQKKRFKHESLITEQLDHPHIVRIIERGEVDDCWYIAMELLRGESLALLIKRGGRLPVAEALDIMLQIVDALRAIHGQNIVHRDLKPENIMISEQRGRPHYVKLLDFGLAITPAQSRLTMSGVVMGTIRYLPPERISDGTSSTAGDIYSAGIILYEMLTGSKPFWSEATGEVIHRILETYPLPAREINPGIPKELEALIKSMIDKDPARRPALAAVESELRRLGERFSGSADQASG